MPANAERNNLDSQRIELLGRNRLIDELLRANLEVALPIRDRGIDLIAYVDLDSRVSKYTARPIQMKAASAKSLAIDRKYEKFRGLIIAFVWDLNAEQRGATYALTFEDLKSLADKWKWLSTDSWEKNGIYTTNQPSRHMIDDLEPHKMDKDKWWQLIAERESV